MVMHASSACSLRFALCYADTAAGLCSEALTYDDTFAPLFPPSWHVALGVTRDFCVISKAHLDEILDQSRGSLDVALLTHSLPSRPHLAPISLRPYSQERNIRWAERDIHSAMNRTLGQHGSW